MDHLTFITANAMLTISLCGIVYLGKQCVGFILWLIKAMVKEEEGGTQE